MSDKRLIQEGETEGRSLPGFSPCSDRTRIEIIWFESESQMILCLSVDIANAVLPEFPYAHRAGGWLQGSCVS
jgi:hypothetical protein